MSLSLSFFVFLCLSLSFFVFLCLSLSFFVFLCLSVSLCLFMPLSFRLFENELPALLVVYCRNIDSKTSWWTTIETNNILIWRQWSFRCSTKGISEMFTMCQKIESSEWGRHNNNYYARTIEHFLNQTSNNQCLFLKVVIVILCFKKNR